MRLLLYILLLMTHIPFGIGRQTPTGTPEEKAARIWNLGGTTVYETEIWRLLAAFRTDGCFLWTGGKTKGGLSWRAHWWNETRSYPQACVPYSFMILVGSMTLSKMLAYIMFIVLTVP